MMGSILNETHERLNGNGPEELLIEKEAAAKSQQPIAELPEGYVPSADEEFMNPLQQEYFRRKLIAWKEDILREARETLETLQSESLREPDVTDRASSETDWSIELRTRDRQRKLGRASCRESARGAGIGSACNSQTDAW